MSAEGWICPLCRCGVAPYELRCPCAGPVKVRDDTRPQATLKNPRRPKELCPPHINVLDWMIKDDDWMEFKYGETFKPGGRTEPGDEWLREAADDGRKCWDAIKAIRADEGPVVQSK